MVFVGVLTSGLAAHAWLQSVLGSVTGMYKWDLSALVMAFGLRIPTNWKETFPVRQVLCWVVIKGAEQALLLGSGGWNTASLLQVSCQSGYSKAGRRSPSARVLPRLLTRSRLGSEVACH